jgi:hypothetical protein
MTASVLSVIAIMVSLAALMISSLITTRQAKYMRHANHLPLLAQMINEIRNPVFMKDQEFIEQCLAAQCDPSAGLHGLPFDVKARVFNVAGFYQSVAALAAFDLVDREKIILLLGRRALRAWIALEPFIEAEREKSEPSATIYSIFEDLATRAEEANYAAMVDSFGLRRRTSS